MAPPTPVVPLPLVLAVLLVARPPYHPEPVRPVLEELARRYRSGEPIYIYTRGRYDMTYYGRSLGLEDWIQGERHYDPGTTCSKQIRSGATPAHGSSGFNSTTAAGRTRDVVRAPEVGFGTAPDLWMGVLDMLRDGYTAGIFKWGRQSRPSIC